MIEKKKVPRVNGNSLSEFKENIEGFNEAIDLQGQRKIGLNREKLAIAIWIDMGEAKLSQKSCGHLADYIIAKEHEFLEVKQ